MARQWIDPATGAQILEDGSEQWIDPATGAQIIEDQAAAPAGGRVMSSLAGAGGLAGSGGIAGEGGGLAG